MDSLIPTHTQQCAIHETEPVHLPTRHFFTKTTNCATTDFFSFVNL